MNEQKPEETEGQVPAADLSQPIPEEIKYQSPETSQPSEEVRPQVIGASQPPEEKASGMAISAMVVGIVGILCSWAIVFSIPMGITALVLGIIEFRRIKDGVASAKGRGMSIAGIILGSLTIFGAIIYIIIIALTAVSFATGMSGLIPSFIEQFGTFY
jgi:hypothetical protein